MTFDFSHLLKRETVNVTGPDGSVLFQVTVREITHGEKADAQRAMFQNINMKVSSNKKQSQREIERAMNEAMRSGDVFRQSVLEEVAAIESWTLKDANGNDVPVCEDAWKALPASLASQIEEVIERLNPDVDDDTKSDDGDES
jgi:hypothetical protein